jgi:hypothetical protein
LPAAVKFGYPLTATIIARVLLLNGIAGVVFGNLFWRFGLETAILAHFIADLILVAAHAIYYALV